MKGRNIWRASLVLAAGLLVSACEGATPTNPPAPASGGASRNSVVEGFRVPAELRTPLRDGPPYPGTPRWLRDLDLDDAATAATLREAPVRRALLAAELSIWSPETHSEDPVSGHGEAGIVYLLTPRGEWRRVDFADYPGRFHSEPQFELSPDGGRLALGVGAERSIVVVDLHDNSHRRYRLPVRSPIRMSWSPDGAAITFSPRNKMAGRHPGYELDLGSGEVAGTPYVVPYSAYDTTRDEVVELGRDGSGRWHLNGYRGGELRAERWLQYGGFGGLDPVVRRYVAYEYRTRPAHRAQGARGDAIVVVDPDTGALRRMLTDDRLRRTWTYAAGWVSDTELVYVSGKPGVVRVWNVESGHTRTFARFADRGIHVSIARHAVADLLRRP